jgi:predicted amidohydrolase
MKVTVCQLPDDPQALEKAFAALVDHTKAEGSDLLLLPEMPFYPWLPITDQVDPAQWQAAVDAHEEWLPRLAALGTGLVLGSRPVLDKDTPHNDAFVWSPEGGARFAHRKYYLPNEEGFWEAAWYRRAAQPSFKAADAGTVKVGFLICSDLWFGEHARGYARQGVHLIVTPRATERASVEKWLAGGRTAAVMAGAYGLSSNRVGPREGVTFGGVGWIVDPNGEILARTSDEQPFVTLEIDPAAAEAAKHTYPRDVKE